MACARCRREVGPAAVQVGDNDIDRGAPPAFQFQRVTRRPKFMKNSRVTEEKNGTIVPFCSNLKIKKYFELKIWQGTRF
jgi:hypothetical protein